MKEATINAIVTQYRQGDKVKNISRRLHLSHETIYKVLRDKHIPLRNISVEEGCLCPFYAETRYNAIRCEAAFASIKDFLIAFEGKEKLKRHKTTLCAGNYNTCILYRIAAREIDEAEGNKLGRD